MEEEALKKNKPEGDTDDLNLKVIDWMLKFQRPLTNIKKMVETPKSYK